MLSWSCRIYSIEKIVKGILPQSVTHYIPGRCKLLFYEMPSNHSLKYSRPIVPHPKYFQSSRLKYYRHYLTFVIDYGESLCGFQQQ